MYFYPRVYQYYNIGGTISKEYISVILYLRTGDDNVRM